MEEFRQNESFTNIPPAKKHQSPKDSEDYEVAPLPFRIYLRSFKETKTQIFASQDRSKWLAFPKKAQRE